MRISALVLLGVASLVAIPMALGALGAASAVGTTILMTAQIGFGISVMAGLFWVGAKYFNNIGTFMKKHPQIIKWGIVTGMMLIALMPMPSIAGPAFTDAGLGFLSQVLGDGTAYAAIAPGVLDAVQNTTGAVLTNTPVKDLTVYAKDSTMFQEMFGNIISIFQEVLVLALFAIPLTITASISDAAHSFVQRKIPKETIERIVADNVETKLAQRIKLRCGAPYQRKHPSDRGSTDPVPILSDDDLLYTAEMLKKNGLSTFEGKTPVQTFKKKLTPLKEGVEYLELVPVNTNLVFVDAEGRKKGWLKTQVNVTDIIVPDGSGQIPEAYIRAVLNNFDPSVLIRTETEARLSEKLDNAGQNKELFGAALERNKKKVNIR